MMDARERCQRDPVFRALVSSFYAMFQQSGDGVTPSEIREAAGYAWQMYYERHAGPSMMVPPGLDVKDLRGGS